MQVRTLMEREPPEIVATDELEKIQAKLMQEMRIEIGYERSRFEATFKLQLNSHSEDLKAMEQSLNRLYLSVLKQ
jgi:hypothetical protein